MDISKKVVLFLTIFFLLISPNFATEDLSNEDYITVAYGRHLEGDYIYKNDNVYWKQFFRDNYEADGYYPVLTSTSPAIYPICELKSASTGIIHLCWIGGNSGLEECKTVGSYNTPNVYQLTDGFIDIEWDNLESGIYEYWFEIDYGGGNYATSYAYRFYVKPEGRWENKRLITITSTENLSEGIVEINLTNEILEEFEDYTGNKNIQYDATTFTLSGTFSRLLFTNADKTKVYPYYIDKHKGGYYGFNNNIANYTTIKIFIDENTTGKSIMMYYNFKKEGTSFAQNPRDGFYEARADLYPVRLDTNNNPFTVHQVFSDWRWTEAMATDILDISANEYTFYNRSNYYRGGSGSSYGIISIKPHLNKLNSFYVDLHNVYLWGEDRYHLIRQNNYTDLLFRGRSDYCRLYNSTQDYDNIGTNNYLKGLFYLDTSNNNLTFKGNINLDIPETNNYFNITEIYTKGQGAEGRYGYINYFSELLNISASIIIYSSQETVSLDSEFKLFETENNRILNDIYIHGILYPTLTGNIFCFDINGTFLAEKEIKSYMINKDIEFELGYFIENETEFLNLNNFSFYCKYVDSENNLILTTETLTETFSNTTRIFINHTKQLNKKQFTEGNYIIPFETQFKFYNYTADQTYDIYYIYSGKNENENLLFNKIYTYTNFSSDYNFNKMINLDEDVNFTGDTYARVNWFYRIYAYNDFYGAGTFQTSDTGYRYYDIGEAVTEEAYETVDWINLYDNEDYEPYGNFVLVGGYLETQDIELNSELYCYDWTNKKDILRVELGRESSETGDIQQVQDLGNDKYAVAFTYVYDDLNISENEFDYYCCVYTTRDNLFCSDVTTYIVPTDKLIITDRKPIKEQNFFTNDINVKATFTPTFDIYSNYSFLVIVGNEYMNFENYTYYLSKRMNETEISFLQFLWKLITQGDIYFNEDFIKDTGVIYSWIGTFNDTYYFDENYTDICNKENCKRQYIIFYWFSNETISAVPVYNYYISYESGGAGYIFIPDVRTYVHADLTDEEIKYLFWGNPLSFLSSFIYVNFVTSVNDEIVSGIFYWVFMIFWNFFVVLLVLFIAVYRKIENIVISIFSLIPFILLFSYLGWFSIPITLIMLMLIAGIVLKLRQS